MDDRALHFILMGLIEQIEDSRVPVKQRSETKKVIWNMIKEERDRAFRRGESSGKEKK